MLEQEAFNSIFEIYGATTMIVQVGSSFLAYTPAPDSYFTDYQRYCLSILQSILQNEDIRVNIRFGHETQDVFQNILRTIKFIIQYEHTLVKEGGRGITHTARRGTIPTKEGNTYLVRVENYETMNTADIVVEYSNPNIANVHTSPDFAGYAKKLLYVAPLFYSPSCHRENRSITTLTTFVDVREPRRAALLAKLTDHTNVNNCFDKEELGALYRKTKIMINIHQTDHHHTFEELRVLPALSCGIVVICEESPLSNLVPYHRHVVWTTYENMVATVEDVKQNYEAYHQKLFANINLHALHELNVRSMRDKIKNALAR